MLDGGGTIWLDGEAHALRRGSLVHIPPGVVHSAQGRMRVLVVGIPDIDESDLTSRTMAIAIGVAAVTAAPRRRTTQTSRPHAVHEPHATSRSIRHARWLVVVAAVMWSTSGLFAKAPLLSTWPLEQRGVLLAFWRTLFAGLFLLPFVRRPQWTWGSGAGHVVVRRDERRVSHGDDSHDRGERDLAAEYGAAVGLPVGRGSVG